MIAEQQVAHVWTHGAGQAQAGIEREHLLYFSISKSTGQLPLQPDGCTALASLKKNHLYFNFSIFKFSADLTPTGQLHCSLPGRPHHAGLHHHRPHHGLRHGLTTHTHTHRTNARPQPHTTTNLPPLPGAQTLPPNSRLRLPSAVGPNLGQLLLWYCCKQSNLLKIYTFVLTMQALSLFVETEHRASAFLLINSRHVGCLGVKLGVCGSYPGW